MSVSDKLSNVLSIEICWPHNVSKFATNSKVISRPPPDVFVTYTLIYAVIIYWVGLLPYSINNIVENVSDGFIYGNP